MYIRGNDNIIEDRACDVSDQITTSMLPEFICCLTI